MNLSYRRLDNGDFGHTAKLGKVLPQFLLCSAARKIAHKDAEFGILLLPLPMLQGFLMTLALDMPLHGVDCGRYKVSLIATFRLMHY